MRKKNKILLISFALILIISIAYLYKEYNRAPADLTNVNPVEKLQADQLMKAFEKDEKMANQTYSGKVVEVTGEISSINNVADSLVSILLETGNPMHQISCTLAPSEIPKIEKYGPNQMITIKGFCTGYLMDVELNRCVIIN